MSGIHPLHLRDCIIRPSLKPLHIWSPSAETLLLLTCAQESSCGKFLKQNGKNNVPRGPALGIFQMEPNTYKDIRIHSDKYIYFVENGLFEAPSDEESLIYDMRLATVMARLKYTMFKEKLPKHDDIVNIARYWDKYYNVNPDKGTMAQALESYSVHIERYL
jgi:hypothetical protein